MRRLLLLILALATLLPSLAQAYDVLVLQSRRDPAYEEVLKGFRAAATASQRMIVLSDYAEVDVVRIVREDRPELMLAVGDTALTAARKIQQTPVIAVMSLGIHNQKASQTNLTGIGMFAAAGTLYAACSKHENPARRCDLQSGQERLVPATGPPGRRSRPVSNW